MDPRSSAVPLLRAAVADPLPLVGSANHWAAVDCSAAFAMPVFRLDQHFQEGFAAAESA